MIDNSKEIHIFAVGDIMLGDHPIKIGNGVGSQIKKKGAKFIFQHVEPILKEGDIICGNLEVPLSHKGKKRTSLNSVSFRGDPKSISGLKFSHFNLFSISNNHIAQHGLDAFLDTKRLLDINHIKQVPVYNKKNKRQKPLIVKIKNKKIGFMAYCFIKDKTGYGIVEPYSNIIVKEIQNIKNETDYIIVILHWGDEYINYPSNKQIKFARKLVNNGVDIILGHHPHVIQRIEKYKGKIIAYSLGNFVFDMWHSTTKKSLILHIVIKNNCIDYKIIPIKINENYQPEPITNKIEKKEFYDWNDKILTKELHLNEYIKLKLLLNKEYIMELKKYFIKNFFRYNPIYSLQIIIRHLFKKR